MHTREGTTTPTTMLTQPPLAPRLPDGDAPASSPRSGADAVMVDYGEPLLPYDLAEQPRPALDESAKPAGAPVLPGPRPRPGTLTDPPMQPPKPAPSITPPPTDDAILELPPGAPVKGPPVFVGRGGGSIRRMPAPPGWLPGLPGAYGTLGAILGWRRGRPRLGAKMSEPPPTPELRIAEQVGSSPGFGAPRA